MEIEQRVDCMGFLYSSWIVFEQRAYGKVIYAEFDSKKKASDFLMGNN